MEPLLAENFMRLIGQLEDATRAAASIPSLATYVDLEQAKVSLLKAAISLKPQPIEQTTNTVIAG
jgi:hypothetical protein